MSALPSLTSQSQSLALDDVQRLDRNEIISLHFYFKTFAMQQKLEISITFKWFHSAFIILDFIF